MSTRPKKARPFPEVPTHQLRWTLDPKSLPFKTTNELEPLKEIVGQDRAMEAFRFGLGVRKMGYHVFVTGPTGTGRMTAALKFLQEMARKDYVPHDLCYVYNFKNPENPKLIRLEAGLGQRFKKDVEHLVDTLKKDVPLLFESEDYISMKREILEKYDEKGKNQPPKPVVRFALPVADDHGRTRGMVVLNYLGQRLRDKLGALEGNAGKIWLLNAEGYWLVGPTPEDEWGFALPARSQRSLAKRFPRLWQQVNAEKSGVHQTATSWVRFERIYPLLGGSIPADFAKPVDADSYYLTIAVELPRSTLQAVNFPLLKKLWMVYGALVLFAFLVAAALAFAINRNKALAQFMEKVVDDHPLQVSFVDSEQRYRFNNMAYERYLA